MDNELKISLTIEEITSKGEIQSHPLSRYFELFGWDGVLIGKEKKSGECVYDGLFFPTMSEN